MIICDGDLLVFLSLQLALVEAERPLEDVFDLQASSSDSGQRGSVCEKKTNSKHIRTMNVS